MAENSGTAARVFKCPYHAWCYDINGRLLGQPLAQDAFAEVDNAEYGLVPLPVQEVGGLLLLRPTATGAPIDGETHLAGLADELQSHEFADFTLFAEQHHELACNWKQPYETFLEAYHVFELHRSTLARQILSTPMLADFMGPHGRGLLMGRRSKDITQQEIQERTLHEVGNLVYWLFPNAVLSMPSSGHAELWLFYPDQRDPGRCHVHLKFYVPTATAEDNSSFWKRMLDYSSSVVLEEDFTQQEAIYRGLSSGSHPGPVFGRNEPALVHFHRSLDAALATGPQSSTPETTAGIGAGE